MLRCGNKIHRLSSFFLSHQDYFHTSIGNLECDQVYLSKVFHLLNLPAIMPGHTSFISFFDIFTQKKHRDVRPIFLINPCKRMAIKRNDVCVIQKNTFLCKIFHFHKIINQSIRDHCINYVIDVFICHRLPSPFAAFHLRHNGILFYTFL